MESGDNRWLVVRWTLEISSLKVLMARLSFPPSLATRSLLENLRASRPLNDPSSREKRERENLFLKCSQTRNYVGTWYYAAITCHAGRTRNATMPSNRVARKAWTDLSNPSLQDSLIGRKDWYYTTRYRATAAIALLDFPLVPFISKGPRSKIAQRDRSSLWILPLSAFKLFPSIWKSSAEDTNNIYIYSSLLIINQSR